MLKTSSIKNLNVPFEIFANGFDLDQHFLLQGIKNHRFLYASIELKGPNLILVRERKGMWFLYKKINENQTSAECFFPFGIILIILCIISLFFIIGFVVFPILILMRYLLTKHNVSKIERNYLMVFEKQLKSMPRNSATSLSSKMESIAYEHQDLGTVIPPPCNKKNDENIATPPPFSHAEINHIPILNVPPPIPKSTTYFIVYQGVQKGPLSEAALKEMIGLNLISANTLVWREGMDSWKKISEVEI